MKNIQVTIDPETLTAVDRAARPLGLKRSAIVRQALREWLHRRSVERFEEEWVAGLKKKPDDPKRADDWLASQVWGPK
jgi:metal-responsive CopG/Arc/MetJ family transcriptional regulator